MARLWRPASSPHPPRLGAAGAALRAKSVDQLTLVHLRAALNAEFLGPLLEVVLRPLLVWRRHASSLAAGRLGSPPPRPRRAVPPRRLRAGPPGPGRARGRGASAAGARLRAAGGAR